MYDFMDKRKLSWLSNISIAPAMNERGHYSECYF